ncbi:DUF4956 domain-containing protein [Corynebacterium vitaeruminis]|uniref:DUF4956 domain-containing protein n=1 Tax=Corynebacterium vitaeruminis DSM 20294 TaxID=1224164 RepID=W5XY90_9CORY|nr:DUF4956 domain-containing protein [Corynebacterium vitaeruminis]AHI21655.1 hypothetical protein B843_01295 [Corynebacterium vitaeruminis DSM 20294]
MTATAIMIAIDFVAMGILTFGIYFPRHHRSDLIVAFWGVNIGVLAVSQVLANTHEGAELGLGLFGVLSIIRLRSSEINQREVSYYFTSLAMGLIAGLATSVNVFGIVMIVLPLLVVSIADTDAIARRGVEHTTIQLDRAIADPDELHRELEDLTGAHVKSVKVNKLDLVNDLTLVEVSLHRDPDAPSIQENPQRESIDTFSS